MATRYASLGRCSELPERDVIAALLSREECASLLARIAMMDARVASRALLALVARLATPACTWLEGELAVELFDDDRGTKVRLLSDLGGGLRERVLPAIVVAEPLAVIATAIDKRRELHAVLRLERVSSRCLLLLPWGDDVAAAAAFDISETSLAWSPLAATAEEVDSGWDDDASTATA